LEIIKITPPDLPIDAQRPSSRDDGAVAGCCRVEEQVAAASSNRQVADLVDDKQRTAAQEADFLAQRALAFGLGEDSDEIGKRNEVDALAGTNGLDREGGGEMGFAGSGWPEQVDDLGTAMST
jgi:hypothetical protein